MLLADGARVAIAGSSQEKGEAALGALGGFAADLIFVRCDVSRPADCARLVRLAVTRFGGLDIVVNSAGIYLEKQIADVSEEEYARVMDVNVKGTYFLTKYAVPELKKSGSGAIVNVSSDAGLRGNNLCTAYCAAKGAVAAFTRALALELAPNRIRVNCVCPGDTASPMLERQLAAADDPSRMLWEIAGLYPLGRVGNVYEVAAAICFLASDRASLITGVALPVDGGLTAC
jgi:NAD(P)-dependent dehydrogenase (short-subunit alcohol dehydrogenase family)